MGHRPASAGGSSGANAGWPGGHAGGDSGYGIKEELGLPGSLPPIRLPPLAELAAQARKAPLCARLAALADWVGAGGRDTGPDGYLPEAAERAAVRALGAGSGDDLAFLWEYALAAGWLAFDEGSDRVLPGPIAGDWWSGKDDRAFGAWRATLSAVLTETLYLVGPPGVGDELAEGEFRALDEFGEPAEADPEFGEQALALVVLLFVARRDGVSRADFADVLWEDATAWLAEDEAAMAREDWLAGNPDPALVLLEELAGLDAVTEDGDVIRLTPPALAAVREELLAAGVDVPLLPQTAAGLTAAQLLTLAATVTDEEFDAECDEWIAARGAGPAARDLLRAAAHGEPGERLLAVAAVTRIGPRAAPAWRASLDEPPLRGYAKVALLGLAGIGPERGPRGDLPPELEPLPDDLAWMATDVLALACDDEFPDPDELAASFREAVPPGGEAALFDAMWRGVHPDAAAVLNHVGRYHPDKRIAKAARTAAHKAASRARLARKEAHAMADGNLSPIEHVVVLMLENRSFDHMLGYLYADSGNLAGEQPFEGLTGAESCPDKNGTQVSVSQITSSTPNAYFMPGADPGEGYKATNDQLWGSDTAPASGTVPTMEGFVKDFAYTITWETNDKWTIVPGTTADMIMGCFTPEMLPVLSHLARGYAVCDHWYASVPTETMPNRAFACAATSQGSIDDNTKKFSCPSIFGALTKAGVSWQIFGYDAEPLTKGTFTDITGADPSHFGRFTDFQAAAKAGTLPAFTFLEPNWTSTGNSQHPNYDVALGEQLIYDTYEALRGGPGWPQTLFVLTYDEHGGCYDHVPPPWGATPPDNSTNALGFGFDRFGVRVPTVLISPLIAAGTVYRVPPGSTPLDHTSILKVVEQIWGIPALTARDAAAPSFIDVLTLTPATARDDDVLAGVDVPQSGSAGPSAGQVSHLEAVRQELVASGALAPASPAEAAAAAALREAAPGAPAAPAAPGAPVVQDPDQRP